MDQEVETVVRRRVNHQADGVERVGEDLEQRAVPGPGRALVGHEDDNRLALALDEFHLGHARAHAPDVARERIGEHVLARAIELQFARKVGAGDEHVPGQFVNLAGVHARGDGS